MGRLLPRKAYVGALFIVGFALFIVGGYAKLTFFASDALVAPVKGSESPGGSLASGSVSDDDAKGESGSSFHPPPRTGDGIMNYLAEEVKLDLVLAERQTAAESRIGGAGLSLSICRVLSESVQWCAVRWWVLSGWGSC